MAALVGISVAGGAAAGTGSALAAVVPGLAVLVLVIVLSLRRPDLIVVVLVAYLPLEPWLTRFLPPDAVALQKILPESALYLCVTMQIVHRVLNRRKWIPTPMDSLLLAVLALAVVSALANGVPWQVGLAGIRGTLRYVAAFYVLTQCRPVAPIASRVVWIVVGLGVVESAIAIGQMIGGPEAFYFLRPETPDVISVAGVNVPRIGEQIIGDGNRVFATMGRYDLLGTFLVLCTLLGASLLCHGLPSSRFTRRILVLGEFAMIAALVQTYSRQSVIGLLAGFVVLYFFTRKRLLAVVPALAVASVALAAIFLGPEESVMHAEDPHGSFVDRIIGGLYLPPILDADRYGRAFAVMIVAPRVLDSSPVLGMGPGAIGSGAHSIFDYLGAYDSLSLDWSEVSSAVGDVGWVALLAQFGIIGLMLFAGVYAQFFATATRQYQQSLGRMSRSVSAGYASYVAAHIAFGFFTSPLEVRYIAFYLWVFGGIVASLPGAEAPDAPLRANAVHDAPSDIEAVAILVGNNGQQRSR